MRLITAVGMLSLLLLGCAENPALETEASQTAEQQLDEIISEYASSRMGAERGRPDPGPA